MRLGLRLSCVYFQVPFIGRLPAYAYSRHSGAAWSCHNQRRLSGGRGFGSHGSPLFRNGLSLFSGDKYSSLLLLSIVSKILRQRKSSFPKFLASNVQNRSGVAVCFSCSAFSLNIATKYLPNCNPSTMPAARSTGKCTPATTRLT